MRKVSKKVVSCFMLCALMMSSIMGFAINSNAADVDGSKIQREDGTYVYYVDTQSSLGEATRSANDGDCIEFTKDIVCSGIICVHKDITIDFNSKSLRFINTVDGLCINANGCEKMTLKNGAIYGDNDSNSAVYVCGGPVRFKCMEIYGGDCKKADYYLGNGIYVDNNSTIYMDDCFITGGNGYKNNSDYCFRTTGLAIRNRGKVIKEGRGYERKEGMCKPGEKQ